MPGLMLGIAGIGMHFLRLAHPDRVPSPLLLESPPGGSAQSTDRDGPKERRAHVGGLM